MYQQVNKYLERRYTSVVTSQGTKPGQPPKYPLTTGPALPIKETSTLTITVIHCTVLLIALLTSVESPEHSSLILLFFKLYIHEKMLGVPFGI